MNDVVIVGYEQLSAYGMGVEALQAGLFANRVAIRACRRFRAATSRSAMAASALSRRGSRGGSRAIRLVAELFRERPPNAPAGAALLVATTIGEIEQVEDLVLTGQEHEGAGRLPQMLPKVSSLAGVQGPAAIVSAACASSTAALTRARMMIRAGDSDAVLVVGVDALSEFLCSGFSSLMALDEKPARPFDRDRTGLSLGEAAAYLLVMSGERARREDRAVLARLAGAAMTCDANHMTGPSRDGAGLARAALGAVADAGLAPESVALVAAHGTGTRYNDAMEMKALATVFSAPRPTFSLKGGIGHTMGSAGLLQTIAAVEALRTGKVPPTPGVRDVDDDALGWVSPAARECHGSAGMVLNAGFGGINAAVVVRTDRTEEPR